MGDPHPALPGTYHTNSALLAEIRACSVLDLDNLKYGIGQARRGWLEKQDVLDTRPLESLLRLLGKVRA